MKVTKLSDLVKHIENWKKENKITDNDYVEPNSGKRRTKEKRELLKQLRKQGSVFKSNIGDEDEKED